MPAPDSPAELDAAAMAAALTAGGARRDRAIARLYQALALRMLRYFERQRLSIQEAEDALQETFLNAVRALGSTTGAGFTGASGSPAALEVWLWAIARNSLTNAVRRRLEGDSLDALADDDTLDAYLAVHPQLVTRDAPAGDATDCVTTAYASFEAAHPGRGETLRLVYTEGWSGEQIAAYLGRSHGAAREYISQCRAKFVPFVKHCLEWLEA
jgi:RNA polymerase sigma factor (sigma-70 family)